MDSTLICIACDKKIENNAVFFEGYPYHRKCICCPFHHETNITGNIESDFVQVVPGIFLCSKHYGDYRVIQHLPSNIVKKYKKKYLQTIIPRLFCPPPILGDAIVLDKPYDVFLPTVQYHFDKNINDVDFMQLQEFLGDDVKIINAKNGSTIFKVILIAIKEFIIEGAKIIWRKFKKWAYNTIEKLTEKLLTKAGGLIIGNMVESPTISIPDENKIIDFLNRPEYNSLKIQLEAGVIDLNTMMLQVVEMVRNENFPQRAKYYINLGKEVDDAENQIIENNKMSKYELKIINKISNTNANPQNYEKIVNRFAYDEIVQTYLYHGNNLNGNLNDDSNVYLKKSNKFLINS